MDDKNEERVCDRTPARCARTGCRGGGPLDEVDLNYVLVALQYMSSSVARRKPDVEYYLQGVDEEEYLDALARIAATVRADLDGGGR